MSVNKSGFRAVHIRQSYENITKNNGISRLSLPVWIIFDNLRSFFRQSLAEKN